MSVRSAGGSSLSRQEPERARVLLDEATHRGLDYESYAELVQMTLTAAMLGDWPLTARFATRSIPHVHWINNRPYLHAVFSVSARALAGSDPEAAAIVQGAAHTLITAAAAAAPATAASANGNGLIVETRRESTRLLVDALGDEQLRALRDEGAAMDTDTAVAYTLAHLDAFLTNTDD